MLYEVITLKKEFSVDKAGTVYRVEVYKGQRLVSGRGSVRHAPMQSASEFVEQRRPVGGRRSSKRDFIVQVFLRQA